MLRTIWFVLNLFIYTVWYASKSVLAGLFRVPNTPGGVYDECARRWSLGMLRAAGIDARLVNWEKAAPAAPAVFVSNHQSWFDIFLLAGLIPLHVRFVSKKELQKVPILGMAMKAAGHIFIDRENRQKAFGAYDEVSKAIRSGLSAIVFPEGTRSRTGELQPFKKGPFVLAIAAQVPIVPTYCAGTFTLLPRGTVWLNPHPIAALFGDPISTTGMTYDDRERLMKETRTAVEKLREASTRALAVCFALVLPFASAMGQQAVPGLKEGQVVKVRRGGSDLVQGRFARAAGDSILLDSGKVAVLQPGDSVFGRVSATKAGAIAGGIVGGALGLVVSATSDGVCDEECSGGVLAGGAAMVGAPMALLGAALGSARRGWKHYPILENPVPRD